ncbi:unnamed protein product [Rangifer tarandus platyrhynchus]|uniref:Uncharacterized protein n=2 Tax=Rangifer tarandus platyrhynchus TaxID=3082113 RepID=A0ACB0FE67_RANTA|nr:unnamed protein product [Rangifer tarandus platyrhynchus]CAI9711370.1 unnamed protein product [Rangifer tarandus platyrhynchus]
MTVVGGTERKGPYECSHTESWKAETQESELGGLVNEEVTNAVPRGQAAWRSSQQPHSVKYCSLKPVAWEQIVGGLVNGSSPLRLEVRASHLCFHCQLCSDFCGCGNSMWVTACCWLELVVNVDPREAERNGGEYCLSLSCHKSEQSDTISEQLTASSG